MKIEIVKSDYGYTYRFYLKEPDGSATNLSDASAIKLRATHSEFPSVTIEKTMEVESAVNGSCLYTLGENDFSKDGVYSSEIEVTFDGESGDGERITYQGFTLVVLPKV